MTMGLLKFVTSKVLAIIVAWGLILFDEQLRRRDTVESKRIFNLALLTGIGALLDLVTTYFDWNFFLEPRGKEVLVRAMVIAILCCAKEMLALQIVIGWNLHIDYAIYKSYEHVKNKQEKSGYPNGIGICFKAPGSGEKFIPVLNSVKLADAEIFSLGEDQFLVMARPQSKSAIRLLIKTVKLKAQEAESPMAIESSYAIRDKEESTADFTKRLLELA